MALNPYELERDALLDLISEKFADNTTEEISPADARLALLSLAYSAMLKGSDALSVNQLRGGTHLKPTLATMVAIPFELRVVGMSCVVANPAGPAELAAGVVVPPATFTLVKDSQGLYDAAINADSGVITKATWVLTSGTEEEKIASYPVFIEEDHPYKKDDPVQYTFPDGAVRLFRARKDLNAYMNPVPTGLDNDPNWIALAPLAGSTITLADAVSTVLQQLGRGLKELVDGEAQSVLAGEYWLHSTGIWAARRDFTATAAPVAGANWRLVFAGGGTGGGSTAWNDIIGKPATFTPTAHTQTAATITDFNTAADGRALLATGRRIRAWNSLGQFYTGSDADLLAAIQFAGTHGEVHVHFDATLTASVTLGIGTWLHCYGNFVTLGNSVLTVSEYGGIAGMRPQYAASTNTGGIRSVFVPDANSKEYSPVLRNCGLFAPVEVAAGAQLVMEGCAVGKVYRGGVFGSWNKGPGTGTIIVQGGIREPYGNRGAETLFAEIGGGLYLPPYTQADWGKVLGLNPTTGALEWVGVGTTTPGGNPPAALTFGAGDFGSTVYDEDAGAYRRVSALATFDFAFDGTQLQGTVYAPVPDSYQHLQIITFYNRATGAFEGVMAAGPGNDAQTLTVNLSGSGQRELRGVLGGSTQSGSSFVGIGISQLAALNGTSLIKRAPTTPTDALVVVNDSIPLGDGTTNASRYAWTVVLRELIGWGVALTGWGARATVTSLDTTAKQQAEADRICAYLAPIAGRKEVWWPLGTNDFGYVNGDPALMAAYAASVWDKIHAQLPGVKIWVCRLLYRGNENTNTTAGQTRPLSDYSDALSDAAATRAFCAVVDTHDWATQPSDFFEAGTEALHLTNSGNYKYVTQVVGVLTGTPPDEPEPTLTVLEQNDNRLTSTGSRSGVSIPDASGGSLSYCPVSENPTYGYPNFLGGYLKIEDYATADGGAMVVKVNGLQVATFSQYNVSASGVKNTNVFTDLPAGALLICPAATGAGTLMFQDAITISI